MSSHPYQPGGPRIPTRGELGVIAAAVVAITAYVVLWVLSIDTVIDRPQPTDVTPATVAPAVIYQEEATDG